jgi:hypothetical protein
MECLNVDRVTTQQGGIITHHRKRKGQRGGAAEHRLLCYVLDIAHRIGSLMDFFGS